MTMTVSSGLLSPVVYRNNTGSFSTGGLLVTGTNGYDFRGLWFGDEQSEAIERIIASCHDEALRARIRKQWPNRSFRASPPIFNASRGGVTYARPFSLSHDPKVEA